MKIIFSPEYSGSVYVKPSNDKGVMMDTIVANTIGLINILEIRLGIHHKDINSKERLALYYRAVSQYMNAHPDNVMAASFKTASLSTAKELLIWREELLNAGWNFEGSEISQRLAVLIGIEAEYSKQNILDISKRLNIVVNQMLLQQFDCKDITIETPLEIHLLKPIEHKFIKTLESLGATIIITPRVSDSSNNLCQVRKLLSSKETSKITLDKNDNSIQIWKFADERLACEYLSYNNLEDTDVWINSNNKQMDSWLMLMSKSLTGSVTPDSVPQLTQLFVMGLGMFSNPLNVYTLIEWLNMPLHPIDKFFRSRLADCIVKEGGYRNEACLEKINKFIKGEYVYLNEDELALPEEDQRKLRLKDMKKRQKQVDIFLPSLEQSKSIKTKDVKTFVVELSSWARQRVLLMSKTDNEQWMEQLIAVSEMCDAFHTHLLTINEENIDYKTIDSWMSTIYQRGDYTNAIAEKGCRIVVDSPAKLASIAQKTIWIGVDGDTRHRQECAFLYPSESTVLQTQKYIQLWDSDVENAYYEQMMLTPFRMTEKQLILVVRERLGGEQTLKHPLLVRLEQQIENIQDFITYPSIGADKRHQVEAVKHEAISGELHIEHTDKLQWPNHLSPTAVNTLVEYPFDFLMERLLDINGEGIAQMSDIKTTKGNVAHAVIDALFSPQEGTLYAMPEDIELRIREEYEETYNRVLETKGAILRLSENVFEEKVLHRELRKCLDALLQILKDNQLKVLSCETRVNAQMNLGLPKRRQDDNDADYDLIGFIDMILEDKGGNPVVFDFKWTTSKQLYQNKLKDNRSIQLELYRHLLSLKQEKQVQRVAYFLMPQALLYSQEQFTGKNTIKLDPENYDNIVEQLEHSVKYRIKQILEGTIEVRGIYDELQYVKDTKALGLFPLNRETNDKEKLDEQEANFFSQYKLFNK